MTDTAQTEEVVEVAKPLLDLDAMLEDLHNGFPEPEEKAGKSEDDEEFARSAPYTGVGRTADTDVPGDEPEPEDQAAVDQTLETLLPPGYVQVGDEVLPENEWKALLELNRRVKTDPDTATRVRAAILGEKPVVEQVPDPDQLPVWLNPDDEQAVFLFRQQQRIDRELTEVRQQEATRQQQAKLSAQETRKVQVLDAFRTGMKEFRDEHPALGPEEMKEIISRASSMGLLENPEKVGETLQGGIITALDTAMWSLPDIREKVAGGATVPDKQKQSSTRKQKSSALSSSTGSVVRTQSQEPTPTNRKEVMASALNFLRSGSVAE